MPLMRDRSDEASCMTVPVFELRLSIEPVAKERPRFNRKTGTAFTPQKTRAYENALAQAFQDAGAVPIAADEQVEVHLLFGIAGSKLLDGDNAVKACLDAGNKVLYADDSQVTKGTYEVEYGVQIPYVEVRLFLRGAQMPVTNRSGSRSNARSRKKEPLIEGCACGRDHMEMLTDPEVGDLLCVEHKRHLPCRSCMAAQRTFPTGYDLCPQCQKRSKLVSSPSCRGCA